MGALTALPLWNQKALAQWDERALAQLHEKLPPQTTKLPDFIWAVGIEDTFIPESKPGLRPLDEYELTQHYQRWHGDLDRIAGLGVRTIRWGLPWYKIEPSRGKFDWSWSDQVLGYMIDELHIDPILDMIHYGTPTWMPQAFLDPDYPICAGEYTEAVMQRYGSKLKYFTPMNEPTVGADFALRRGQWPPYGNSEGSFVKGMLGIARGIQAVTAAIRRSKNDAVIVAVEALHKYIVSDTHSTTPSPLPVSIAGPAAAREPALARPSAPPLGLITDLQAWDLSRGVVDGAHSLYEYFLKNGATADELALLRQKPVQQDILGVNFYPWSVERAAGDKSDAKAKGTDLKELLNQAYSYAKVPLMVTETSADGILQDKKNWMSATIDAVHSARLQGVPVCGYTWFPAFAMIDWAYRTNDSSIEKNIIQLGLYDGNFDEKGIFQRQETPLVSMYKEYAKKSAP